MLEQDTFWTALSALGQCFEAIVVALTATAILWQVRRWREESASHKFEVITVLLENLGPGAFEKWFWELEIAIKGKNWATASEIYPRMMLRVDFVALLIEIGFISRELVVDLRGELLNEFGGQLAELETRSDNPYALDVYLKWGEYPRGRELVEFVQDSFALRRSGQTTSEQALMRAGRLDLPPRK